MYLHLRKCFLTPLAIQSEDYSHHLFLIPNLSRQMSQEVGLQEAGVRLEETAAEA